MRAEKVNCKCPWPISRGFSSVVSGISWVCSFPRTSSCSIVPVLLCPWVLMSILNLYLRFLPPLFSLPGAFLPLIWLDLSFSYLDVWFFFSLLFICSVIPQTFLGVNRMPGTLEGFWGDEVRLPSICLSFPEPWYFLSASEQCLPHYPSLDIGWLNEHKETCFF